MMKMFEGILAAGDLHATPRWYIHRKSSSHLLIFQPIGGHVPALVVCL